VLPNDFKTLKHENRKFETVSNLAAPQNKKPMFKNFACSLLTAKVNVSVLL
jgi:hypothetical protein